MVIPAAIKGPEKMLPKGRKLVRLFTRLQVRFGEPLKLDRFYLMDDTKAASQEIVDEIMAQIARLQEMDRRL